MELYELFDVDVQAITICKKGANGQRIFLKKSVAEDQLVELPAEQTIIKSTAGSGDSWSAFYCVVAAPGVIENGGELAPEKSDIWRSEDDIRKAAHKFMKNGPLVTRLHESLEPYGSLVENAVALADFSVETPEGPQTIKKGSWYVAIEPSEEGRTAVENGEFAGISLEGSGVRQPVQKSRAGDDTLLRRIAKKLGISVEEPEAEAETIESSTLGPSASQEEDVENKELQEKVEGIESQVNDLKESIEPLAALAEPLAKMVEKAQEEEKPTAEELQKSLQETTETLQKLQSDIEALSEGASDQDDEPDTIRKQKSDHPLAGLLD